MAPHLAHFVANDKAHARALLIHKLLPLQVKAEIRRQLDAAPDGRLMIHVSENNVVTVSAHVEKPVEVTTPEPIISPDQPAKPRRSRK